MKLRRLLIAMVSLSLPVLALHGDEKPASTQSPGTQAVDNYVEHTPLAPFNDSTIPSVLSHKANTDIPPELVGHAAWLNEVSRQRRVRTLADNPQSGLFKGFVHTAKGNVSFARRWMVTAGRLPIVMSLVYDSAEKSISEYGNGWRLNYSEYIETDQFGNKVHVDQAGNRDVLTHIHHQDARSIALQLPEGTIKRFERMGAVFRLVEIADKNNNQLRLEYHQGVLTKVVGDNGHFVTIKHDGLRVIGFEDDQNRTVSFGYDGQGQLQSVTDLGGNSWYLAYDKDLLLTKITDPNNQTAAQFSYYADGKAKFSKYRAAAHHYQYKDLITKVKTAGGKTATFEHDSEGKVISVTNPNGVRYALEFNQQGQVAKLWQSDVLKAEFDYKDGLLQTLLKDDKAYSYQYDNAQRVSGVYLGNKRLQGFEYDLRGNLTGYLSEKVERFYRYSDKGDVLEEKTVYPGLTMNIAYYRYNDDGLVESINIDQNISRFEYTPLGQLAKVTFPDGTSHRYSYNKLGFRVDAKQGEQNIVDYQYDALGNLLTIDDRKSGELAGTGKIHKMLLDGDNLTRKIEKNNRAELEVGYDLDGLPTSLKRGSHKVDFEYDKLGRLRAAKTAQGDKVSYQYKENEPDIRWQLDDRTQDLTNLSPSGAMGQDIARYVRGAVTPWQHIAWTESMSVLTALEPLQLGNQDSLFQASKQRRRLYDAKAIGERYHKNFDKPSNAIFRPAEYIYDNCTVDYDDDPNDTEHDDGYGGGGILCVLADVELKPPSGTILANQNVTFNAEITASSYCVTPTYHYYVNGTAVERYSSNNQFSYNFTSSGTYEVGVHAYCPCSGELRWHTIAVNVQKAKLASIGVATPAGKIWTIDRQRNMPSVQLQASYQPQSVPLADITFHWYLTLNYSANGRSYTHRIPEAGSIDIIGTTMWTPQWGTLLAGANNMTVYISATYDGHTTPVKAISGYQIHGENPTLSQIFDIATTEEAKAVCWKESSHRQFTGEAYDGSGLPVYGPPDGWGLMQRDPLQGEYQLWDWQRALKEGVEYLNERHGEAEAYLEHWYNDANKSVDPNDDWNWDPGVDNPNWVWDDGFSRYNTGDPIFSPNGNGGVRNCIFNDPNGNSIGCSYADKVREHLNNKPWITGPPPLAEEMVE